ncbi:hypothetical protein [uncultured Pseudoteredinibacter sp.]|uniref:hypothetical protein n=1 Tax=uncultured Pseudoteredinibacter sp. TaxID=1641701 RepID=UPI00260B79DB|nr:hypothetical protein [uncultured Pseudoteredinibacter sp.]
MNMQIRGFLKLYRRAFVEPVLRAIVAILLVFNSGSTLAEVDCEQHVLAIEPPKFPNSSFAGKTLLNNGACRIKLAFMLKEGRPVNVRAVRGEERCRVFDSVSVTAIEKSTFQSEVNEKNCVLTLIFEVEI